MSIQLAPTIEEDAQSYVDVLNGPVNGWGQHVCKRTGYVSHWMLKIGYDLHGQINFTDAVDNIFKALRKERKTDETALS